MTTIRNGDRIVRKESIDSYFAQTEKYEIWKLEQFYKGNISELRKQLESLSVYEKAFLFSIVTYVGYEDCCIKYDNGKCLDFDDFVRISRISRSKTSEVIKSLIKKDILFKGTNSQEIQYFVNPWLFCKGQRINVVLKTMFRNYHIKIMGNVKWGDLTNR